MHLRALLFVLIVFGLAPLASGQGAKEDKALEGAWAPIKAELGGKKLPEAAVKDWKLIITGNKYTVHTGEATDKGTVAVDATKKPRALEITGTDGPNKGKTILAIYELKGDMLTVCYDLSGKAHPNTFATKEGTQLFLVTYQRAKAGGKE